MINNKAKHLFFYAVAFSIISLVLIPLFGLAVAFFDLPYQSSVLDQQNVIQLWEQSGLIRLILNTLALASTVSCFSLSIGTWLAWVERRSYYWGASLLGMLDLLPLAMPSYILAAVLREIMGPGGFVGYIFHWPIFRGFIPAVIVLTVITIPYVKLLVFSALSRLSAAEEESAYCLGATKWRVFRTVIFPYLRPSIALAGLITLLYVISDFGAVAILDQPVLTWRLYQAVENQQLANASLLGMVTVLMTLPLFFISRQIQGHMPRVIKVSNPRSPQRVALSLWGKFITYLLHLFVVGVGFLLPVILLSIWVYHGIINHLVFADLLTPLRDSVTIALLSSIGIVILAIFPAWIVARRLIRGSEFLEKGVFLTSSLPGILIAFGLLLAALYFARLFSASNSIYQWLLTSGLLLFLGYTMRFLAEAYASIKNVIILFDPRLRESARLLNVSKLRYFSRVFYPSISPGIKVAFLLSLLAIIKELPVTLLLGNAMGIRTLSFRIFDRYQEAFLQDVGSASLILLALSFLLVVATLRWRLYA